MTAILLFAKAPQPGFAKTRLIPALGAEGAAVLARRLLTATLASALAARLGPVELCVTPALEDPAWRGVVIPDGVRVSAQGEGDLGARFLRVAGKRRGPLLWIGTDCLEMSAGLLREAAVALQSVDVVLYPTVDGGYALLGARRWHPLLFSGIPWSTGVVAEETMRRIRHLGWSLHQGAMLHDLDVPEDLSALDS